MKRRINNLHKGMFKGNKTSNIIELHSRKKQDKSEENIDMNISKYKCKNNDKNISRDNDDSKNNEVKKNNSPNKKERKTNIFNDSFSDSDSSHNKSMIKAKLYNKYTKSGTYFKRLRQQVIDKFISGKPLISIERMYNNPEVKKMFGVQNNSENNYQSNTPYKNTEKNNISSEEEERDRRIPPSKFMPIPNNYNNTMNIQYNNANNYNRFNDNFNNFDSIDNSEELDSNNFNTMNKMDNIYHRNKIPNKFISSNNTNFYQNYNKYNPQIYNHNKKINNNMSFINNENSLMKSGMNDNHERDMFEFDIMEDLNKDFRKKRIPNNEKRDDYMIQLNGINEELNSEYNDSYYYKNENKEYSEEENINNLLNNLKNANNSNYNDEGRSDFPFDNKDNDSYFNNLLNKNKNENNFVNYFKNRTMNNEI